MEVRRARSGPHEGPEMGEEEVARGGQTPKQKDLVTVRTVRTETWDPPKCTCREPGNGRRARPPEARGTVNGRREDSPPRHERELVRIPKDAGWSADVSKEAGVRALPPLTALPFIFWPRLQQFPGPGVNLHHHNFSHFRPEIVLRGRRGMMSSSR